MNPLIVFSGTWFTEVFGSLLAEGKFQRVMALARRIEKRDAELAYHSKKVTQLAVLLARRLRVSVEEEQIIRCAALLHDVGKLQIPDAILNKTESLNADDWTIIRRHPADGAETVRKLLNLPAVAGLILTHHERFDGSGYPCGLRGEKIPLGARILSVADAYSAMTDVRPYRPVRSHDAASAELLRCSGGDFDPRVVEAFLSLG